ncbi:MAG TPA: aspartate--tRNA ligase [archaeon]|nr:aspartate--tRNA ligase [archaeon]
MYRTFNCGELGVKNAGKKAVLAGWVDSRRDHGSLTFIELRDRYGTTQVVLNPEKNKVVHETGKKLRREFVVQVEGAVRKRPKGTENRKLSTGEIEVEAEKLSVLSASEPLPIEISDLNQSSEEARLKHRYLDLRNPSMQASIIARHKITKIVRDFYDENGFLDIETPILAKSTPEGARDYLVPSRVNPGKFFALPQSPQIFKQLLMLSGFDRYMQVARCFRDEDLRADRQPEFTQIDVEMSFVDENDVMEVHERLMQRVFKEFLGVKLKTPFPKLSYDEAIAKYGIDRPDTRFGLELADVTKILSETEFNAFKVVVAGGGIIKAINVPGKADFSRKDLQDLEDFVKIYKAKGLAAFKVSGAGVEGAIVKFFSQKVLQEFVKAVGAKENDLVVVVAGAPKVVNDSLGFLRNHLAGKLGLIKKGEWNFIWVKDFPMFDWSEEEQKLNAMHHPFTSPKKEDLELIEKEPLKVRSNAYDLVLNGVEIGGGSIRIHTPELQSRVFSALGIKEEAAKEKFGFMLEAFKYGAPPHGGIAFGLDRFVMLLVGAETIREVIAFPKNKAAVSLMDGSPGNVDEKQLKELSIKLDLPEEGV